MQGWPRYATLFGLVVVVAFASLIYGYRLEFWGLGTVFGLLKPLSYAALAAAVVSIAAAGALLFRRSFLASVAALAVAGTAAVFGIMPVWMKNEASKVPPIHDITTDPSDPPAFVAIAPLRADAPNPAAYDPGQTEQQLAAYPDIMPLVMPKPLPEAYAIALDAVKAEGLTIVAAVPAEGRIEAYETVPLWGFKDDVVIRLRNAHGVATVIDVRSKSRVGRSDLGFNARRVRSLLDRMEEEGGRLEMKAQEPEGEAI